MTETMSWRQRRQVRKQAEAFEDVLRAFGAGGGRRRKQRHRLGPQSLPARRRQRRGRLRRFASRHRAKLYPLYIAAGMQVTGWIAAAVDHGLRSIILLGLLAAAIVFGWTSRRFHDWRVSKLTKDEDPPKPWRRIERAYAFTVVAVITGWLAFASVLGAGPPMVGWLWFVAFPVVSIPWWWHRMVRPHDEPEEDPDVLTDQETIWKDRVACTGGCLPGSYLEHIEVDKPAQKWEATIVVPFGKLTTDDICGAQPRIASAFDLPITSVVVEPPIDGRATRARLLVVHRNPVDDQVEYDESWAVCEDGCVPIGIFPDGTRAWKRIWQPGSGPVAELISGDVGSGKSRGMELGITQSAMTRKVVPFVADPQGGQSIPAWAGLDGQAAWIATDLPEIKKMLYAVRRAMYARSAELSRREWTDERGKVRRGLDYFDPDVVTDMPIIEVTIDEAHRIFDVPGMAELVEEIALMERKTGIRLVLGTQYPAIDQLGGSMALRNQLAAGNVLSYRISTRITQGMILPSWARNPYDIPKALPGGKHSKGMCVLDTSAPDSARATFLRSVWVREAHHWAEIAAERIPEIDELTRAALGPDFETWRERRDGQAPKAARVQPAIETPAPPAPVTAKIPRWEPPADVEPLSKKDTIVAYLRDRGYPASTGVIARALDFNAPTVSQHCRTLAEDGVISKVRHGRWVAVPATTEQEMSA